MRKFSLLLVALLVITSGAFADQLEFTLTATASATFGVDLDSNSTGFDNSASFTATAILIDDQNAEFGEGETYGYIMVEDFAVDLDVDAGVLVLDSGVVTGKLFVGPAYITLATASDAVGEAASAMVISPVWETTASNATFNPNDTEIAVGFGLGDLGTIELLVASLDDVAEGAADTTVDWDTNTTNSYVLGLIAGFNVAGADIDLEAATFASPTFGSTAAVAVGFAYDLAVGDFTLQPYAGLDYEKTGATTSDMTFIGGVNLKWAGSSAATATIFGSEETVSSGVGAEVIWQQAGNTIVRVGLYESNGDDGLLPVLGAALLGEFELLSAGGMDMSFGAELRANLGTIRPYFGVKFQDLNGATPAAAGINLGSTVHVIDNVTFQVDYASGDLLATGTGLGTGTVYGDGAAIGTQKLGELIVKTTISY